MHKQLLKCVVLVAVAAVVPLAAQVPRQIHVTVADPLNRFVAGLELEHFELVEQGVQRSITGIITPGSPITIAVVGEAPLQGISGVDGPKDLMIHSKSVADALTQLAASTNTRKCLLITTPATKSMSIPGGIETHIVDPAMLSRVVVELRSQYILLVERSMQSEDFVVILKQPRGLPALRAHWKPIATK